MSSSSLSYRPIANATPLGLLAFGTTTAILSAGLCTIAENDRNAALTVGFAFGFGGVVQFLAGIIEFVRNNEFSATAFCVYGGFWLSYGIWKIMETTGVFIPERNRLSYYAAAWAIVTFILLIQTFKINMSIALLFANLTFFFVLLSAAEQTSSDSFLMKFTGGWGIWTALSAAYAAAAELTNTTYEKEVLPMGNFGEVDYGIASPGKGESVVKKSEAPTEGGNIA